MKYLITTILLALAPLGWGEEPLMTMPFKCIVDYQGAVSHRKDSHNAVDFPMPFKWEYRLVPRSDLPADVLAFWDTYKPESIFRNKIGGYEENTYAIRSEHRPSSIATWEGCDVVHDSKSRTRNIYCGSKHTARIFRLNLWTNKFVIAALGSWDEPPRDGVDGALPLPSIFSFGKCGPYYD